MESRELTSPERDCIRWALTEADVADDQLAEHAVQSLRLFRFRPTLRHVSGIRTLIALLALRTRASGITLGHRVFIRADQLDDQLRGSLQLIAHEAAHVAQFARDGTPAFLTRYLGSYLLGLLTGSSERDAYLQISYEKQARRVARLALERHSDSSDDASDKVIKLSDRAT
jgi:hypothetical protein